MDTHTLLVLAVVMIAGAIIGAAVKWLTAWRATPAAAKFPALNYLAGLAIRVGNDALALMAANPTMKPADALAWAQSEFRATAPDAIKNLGADATEVGVNAMVRRGLLSAANAATVTTASTAIIADLAPSATTAKVSPPQIASVAAELPAVAPAVEEVASKVMEMLPDWVKKANAPSVMTHPDMKPAPAMPPAPPGT